MVQSANIEPLVEKSHKFTDGEVQRLAMAKDLKIVVVKNAKGEIIYSKSFVLPKEKAHRGDDFKCRLTYKYLVQKLMDHTFNFDYIDTTMVDLETRIYEKN